MHFQTVFSNFLLFFIISNATAQFSKETSIVAEHPSISNISQSQTKDLGQKVFFDCEVKNPGDNTVTWVKVNNNAGGQNDVVIARDGRVLVEPSDPYRIFANSKNAKNVYTLEINKLRLSDAGTYRCQLTHNVGATTDLFIKSVPVFSEEEGSAKVTGPVVLPEGSSRNLDCNAQGHPTPEIFWSRNEAFTNGSVLGRGNVFSIRFANRKSTRGPYYCLARNSLGEVKKRFDVEVSYVPRITIPRPVFGATVGRDNYLECLSNGYPAPTVTWFKGDKLIVNDDHYRISSVRIEEAGFTNATLHINSMEPQHFGVYLCRVENEIGYVAERISVLQNVVKDYQPPITSEIASKTFSVLSLPSSSKATPIVETRVSFVTKTDTPTPVFRVTKTEIPTPVFRVTKTEIPTPVFRVTKTEIPNPVFLVTKPDTPTPPPTSTQSTTVKSIETSTAVTVDDLVLTTESSNVTFVTKLTN